MRVLVSACLIGENCKYNGGNNLSEAVLRFLEGKEVVSICPELLGGLGVPRPCAEIADGVVVNDKGENVDAIYRRGASLAMERFSDGDFDMAILQSRSPMCGVNKVYDGSFSGKLIPGSGVFARALKERGCNVVDAEDIGKL